MRTSATVIGGPLRSDKTQLARHRQTAQPDHRVPYTEPMTEHRAAEPAAGGLDVDADDLRAFLDASPSPFHAVATLTARLAAAGFAALEETTSWRLEPGGAYYTVRDGGSLVAWRMGTAAPAESGLRLIGTHTDSPTFKVRPRAAEQRHGYRLVGVEPYGGVLTHTWFDRDLNVAGRVFLDTDEGVQERLVLLTGGPLRIPSLAIHLDRSVQREGFRPDPQRHTVPVEGTHDDGGTPLLDRIASLVEVEPHAVLASDLILADAQPASVTGTSLRSGRLDNLLSCYAALRALCATPAGPSTQLLIANDHEEVGSRTAEGAAGSLLADVVGRLAAVGSATDADPAALVPAEQVTRTVRRSLLVSCDAAHALHPNYADRSEPAHEVRFGGGPALKSNANQAYATDAATAAAFSALCRRADVDVQHYVSRADLPCGSTIGPITAARLGLATVDVGAPLLSMHSIREQADLRDVAPLVRALAAHLAAEPARTPVHRRTPTSPQ